MAASRREPSASPGPRLSSSRRRRDSSRSERPGDGLRQLGEEVGTLGERPDDRARPALADQLHRVMEFGTDARRTAAWPGRSALGLRKRWLHPQLSLAKRNPSGFGCAAQRHKAPSGAQGTRRGSGPGHGHAEQGPVSVGRRAPSSALRTTRSGTPSPPGGPCPAPPRTPSSTPARRRRRRGLRSCRSRTWPRNGVILRSHRAPAVGVLADHLTGRFPRAPARSSRARSPDSPAPRRTCPCATRRASRSAGASRPATRRIARSLRGS